MGIFLLLENVKKTAIAQVLEQIIRIYFVTFFINYFLPSGIEYACISLVLGGTISEICSFLLLLFSYNRDIRKKKMCYE